MGQPIGHLTRRAFLGGIGATFGTLAPWLRTAPVAGGFLLATASYAKGIDSQQEILKVRAEVHELAEHLLPDLAARDASLFDVFPEDRVYGYRTSWTVEAWQAACLQLSVRLTRLLDNDPTPIGDAKLLPAMAVNPPKGAYDIEHGRIRWRITPLASVNWKHHDAAILPASRRAKVFLGHHRSLRAAKHWFLQASVRDHAFCDALRYDLPPLADEDPVFAFDMLDVQRYRDRLASSSFLNARKKHQELSALGRPYFCHVLNEALLHVVIALANNRFMEIRRFMQLPSYAGYYLHLAAQHLLAVLVAKTNVLFALRRRNPLDMPQLPAGSYRASLFSRLHPPRILRGRHLAQL